MKALWSWLLRLFGHKSKAPVPAPAPSPGVSGSKGPSTAPAPALTVPAPVPSPNVPPPAPPRPPAPVPVPNPTPPVVTPEPTPGPSLPPSPVPAPPPVPVPGVPPAVPPPVVAPVPEPSPAPVLPSFSDSFDEGKLDVSKWIPSDWSAPGNIPGVHSGHFVPSALDFSHGCLRIKVSQTRSGAGEVTSQGGELQSRQTFGFGTYEWIFRASSTSETPEGSGRPVSGQISSAFTYINDSETEIDSPEIEGDKPSQLSWTSWAGTQNKQYTATPVPAAWAPDAGFHTYKMVWNPTEIDFYVDGVFFSRHSTVVPHVPAYVMVNHWGTNSQGWGGLATPGVDRYMFVKRFSFTPA